MPRKLTNVPRFKSEGEDADWYATPEGRQHTQREFVRAFRAGTLSRSSGLKVAKTDRKVLEQLMEQAKESATRAISIRIPIADLERAERIANETGVGYQTVLKRAIREGLKKTG
jgi:predicted DNA binding CopG/RHH family protein